MLCSSGVPSKPQGSNWLSPTKNLDSKLMGNRLPGGAKVRESLTFFNFWFNLGLTVGLNAF
jgi:hypothetical protein